MADESHRRYVFVAIDRALRFVCIAFKADGSASAARSCLREPQQICVMRIQKVLTDNGMVEPFNGRLAEVIASHHFRSTEDLDTTPKRYVWLYNQHRGQKALNHRTSVQGMKDW